MRSFSWKSGIIELQDRNLTSSPLGYTTLRLSLSGPTASAYGLEHALPCAVLDLSYSVPAHRTVHTSAGILTCFPSSTPFGLGLGSGSPMGGLSFPRKPWTYGEEVSHLLYRYSCLHKLLSRPIVVLTVYRVSA